MPEPVFPVDCVAYCDESKYDGGHRFRALSCVSVRSSVLSEVDAALRTILAETSKIDIGFEDLRTARDCIVATKMMRCAAEFAASSHVQVRTLIWDSQDSRHGPGTDDIRNLERMYVHLLRDVLGRRWSARNWELRPDEQTAIRWETMTGVVENAASKTASRAIEVRHLEQQVSAREPLVQVADLYAGLMSYYALHGSAFVRLMSLPEEERARVLRDRLDPINSASDRERFKMLSHVISLHADAGLATRMSSRGLIVGTGVESSIWNWRYTPVSAEDKAPRRADEEAKTESFVYTCSDDKCAETVELRFSAKTPLCPWHYRELKSAEIARKAERESRREAERVYREGSHFCDSCGKRCTPSSTELSKAEYIGRRPKCPSCGLWTLTSLVHSDSASVDLNDRVSDFETRHDDRWKRR